MHYSFKPGNAIKNAETPVMDELCQGTTNFVSLDASGLAVGLPDGLMGNSEVGHLTIGAGRALYQVCFCSLTKFVANATMLSVHAYPISLIICVFKMMKLSASLVCISVLFD